MAAWKQSFTFVFQITKKGLNVPKQEKKEWKTSVGDMIWPCGIYVVSLYAKSVFSLVSDLPQNSN